MYQYNIEVAFRHGDRKDVAEFIVFAETDEEARNKATLPQGFKIYNKTITGKYVTREKNSQES